MYDVDEALGFLKRIWDYDDPLARCYTIVWIRDRIGYRHFCREAGKDLYTETREWLEENLPVLTRQGFHIYYQVLPLKTKPARGRGRCVDVGIGKWAWIDLDYKKEILPIEIPKEFREVFDKKYYCVEEDDYGLECIYWDWRRKKWIYVKRPPLKKLLDEIMDILGVKPTIVVDSGNGYHVYFELNTVIEAKYLEKLEEKIVDKLGGDPQTKDLARILRLPGTVNPRNNRLARVIYSSNNKIDPGKYLPFYLL